MNATRIAQTPAASPTCARTSGHGRCVRYWTSPTTIWTSRIARTASAKPNRRGASRPPRRKVAEDEDETRREHGHRARVDEDERLQAPEPVDVLRAAARVRPGRSRERARDEQGQAGSADHERDPAELGGDRRLGAAVRGRVGLEREHDRSREDDRGQQQVGGDDRPAKIGLDREVAERSLRERAHEQREREPSRPARKRRRPHGSESGEQHDDDRDSAERAVPELDVRVVVPCRERVALLAARPVAAAEPGVGQPDRSARDHDQPENADGGQRGPEELRRRELEASAPRGGRLDVH